MYDLANEEDRSGDKSPDRRVDLIMQRLNKEKDGSIIKSIDSLKCLVLHLDVVIRDEFIQGCLRDELLRKILAPNTAVVSDEQETTPSSPSPTTAENENM